MSSRLLGSCSPFRSEYLCTCIIGSSPLQVEPGALPAHVASDPAVSEALSMRRLLAAVDVAAMDSWDFDVFDHTHEELAAHLCQMFMQQGLCQSRVSPLPAPRRHAGHGVRKYVQSW